ncbi:mitochondrial ribosomal protein S25-domain-containing protein [Apiosordaria backusii]|uniref:Small ribosomal subunit protein mS23 n=1 Tax=Apiosordaria backusii TaxID=314023 RepID=A0AA40BEE6_9PEZI|nr:mitochondrial ribosomal protein S25-domain-containing protein [Apiosordaria backusii]
MARGPSRLLASRVHKTATEYFSSTIFPRQYNAPPPWNLYRPTKIIHPEDRLREEFYRDHPWELARPMLLIEIDGQDARFRDWSKGLQQPGMKLSGESVVQRQLWLMQNIPGMTKRKAYDQARKEFYRLRSFEETETRIAQEEARAYGGYFGKTVNQVGMELEDKEYNAWLKWAGEEIEGQEMERQAAYANDIDLPEVEEDTAAAA